MKTLGLVALLILASPAGASPVHFADHAFLIAPSCGWFVALVITVEAAPPCQGLIVGVGLPAGDPTSLWGTLAYYPTGFASHESELVSQDRRVTAGGAEYFPIAPPVSGDYYFGLALSSLENGADIIVYSFRLDLPGVADPPLGASPEPSTLLLLGTALLGLGWWKRRGR